MSLSQAHPQLEATSVGSQALFASSIFLGGVSTMVDIFNAFSNNWTTSDQCQ
jgi:hypothetical protein